MNLFSIYATATGLMVIGDIHKGYSLSNPPPPSQFLAILGAFGILGVIGSYGSNISKVTNVMSLGLLLALGFKVFQK